MTKNNASKDVEVSVSGVPEYDGVETWQEQVSLVAPPVTKTAKINMSTSEVKKFMGDNDPALYFRGGKVPNWYKEFGRLLTEEDDEYQLFKSVCGDMPELLLFKHRMQPLYNILVPKPLSEFELDGSGDIVDVALTADMRAIAFGGSNAPRSFEKTFFKLRLTTIHNHLKRGMDRMKEWREHRASLVN